MGVNTFGFLLDAPDIGCGWDGGDSDVLGLLGGLDLLRSGLCGGLCRSIGVAVHGLEARGHV